MQSSLDQLVKTLPPEKLESLKHISITKNKENYY